MSKDKHKCCCKDKCYEKYYCCEKKCHSREHHDHPGQSSCMSRRCCKCGCYCKMIYFKKYKGCCKFVYKCQCGYCFEYICNSKYNYCYEREGHCSGKSSTIEAKACLIDKTYNKKKNCNQNCNKKNKNCKWR